MHDYDIRDVWAALKLASKNFTVLVLIAAGLVLYYEPRQSYVIALFGLIAVQSMVIYSSNRGYFINNQAGTFTFPRSDVENSIIEIILVAPYWNLMRTMTVQLSEIENLYTDTKKWKTSHQAPTPGRKRSRTVTVSHTLYTLNVTGSFGSANLELGSRQKRDEVRNAIQQSVKNHTGRNVDRKVSEFS